MKPALSRRILCLLFAATLSCNGCKKAPPPNPNDALLTLAMDWRPEPEFGGFYQAKLADLYKSHGLHVQLQPGGVGAPTWQLVASGQADFGTTSADQVLIARENGADIVAIFAVYQTSPQGIMVHEDRDFASIKDVFTHPGALGAEDNSWLKFLLKKYGPPVCEIVPVPQGIGVFLARKDFSQQCFVTSEPILAEHMGAAPKSFLVADAGFNPYVTVVIATGKTLRERPDTAKRMLAAIREGWQAYLDDPGAANAEMQKLNPDMDAQTFADAAAAQKVLIDNDDARKNGLGTMTADRWKTLGDQLADLHVIDKAPPAGECFVNVK